MTEAKLETGEYVVSAKSATSASARQLEAWHERQDALAEWRKKDTPANRERLELARNAMDLLLRDDGMDCE